MKLAFNRRQIREDIGVIKLKVIGNKGSRAVMHEL